jgi:hypothetical protein
MKKLLKYTQPEEVDVSVNGNEDRFRYPLPRPQSSFINIMYKASNGIGTFNLTDFRVWSGFECQ